MDEQPRGCISLGEAAQRDKFQVKDFDCFESLLCTII